MNYVFTHHLRDSQAWRQGTKNSMDGAVIFPVAFYKWKN